MKRREELLFEEFATDAYPGREHDLVEVPVARRTFALLGLVAVFVLGAFFMRTVALAGFSGEQYRERAFRNVNTEQPIPAQRGVITDRYGEVLAKNTETFSVFASAASLFKDRALLVRALSQLSATLNIPVEELEEALKAADYESSAEVPIVRNISPEEAIAVRGLNMSGISVVNDLRREYPGGAYFSHIIGYTGSETGSVVVGKTGLERAFDEKLRGVDGAYVFLRDARFSVLDEYMARPPQSGETLTTTIDAGLQRYLHDRLSAGLRSLRLTAGVAIALDPATSEVLALVSLPSYDNNVFVTPGKGAERAALVTDSVHKPLFNRAVSGAYNPGSTIKPFVALAALHERVITAATTMYSRGFIEIPNPYAPDKPSRFVELNQQELGLLDVRSALARSSNVFFYSAGGGFGNIVGLGIDRLYRYWQLFGFGQSTGIELSGEALGRLPTPAEKEERTGQPWRIGDTFNVSIGQGDLQLSPLQLTNYISSIAADGVLRQISVIKDDVPNTTLFDYSEWREELTETQMGMRDGVRRPYGRAYQLNDLPFTSAGKTGSAQYANNTKTNAFFVGYAPFEEPRIALLILVEDAKEGSLNAIPVAKDVFNWYYEHRLNVQDKE